MRNEVRKPLREAPRASAAKGGGRVGRRSSPRTVGNIKKEGETDREAEQPPIEVEIEEANARKKALSRTAEWTVQDQILFFSPLEDTWH